MSLFNVLEQHGTDSKWVLKLVGGRAHIQMAWQVRGGGFADTVAPEGWRQFEHHMTIARELLLAAHALHPERPEAADELITVTMAGYGPPGTDERHWFDQAVKAHFDYNPAYHSIFWALRPRWGGSPQEILRFGQECLATGRFETEVPYQYWYAVWSVLDDMHGNAEVLLREPRIADPVLEMADGYLASQAGPERQLYWHSFKAAVAWRAGRFVEAAQFLDAAAAVGVANTPYTINAFGQVYTAARRAVGETRALSDPTMKQKLAAVDAMLAEGKRAEAKRELDVLAAAAPQNSELRDYLLHRARLAQQLDELNTAGQTTIQPGDSDAGWEVRTGTWNNLDDGSFEGRGHDDGRGILALSQLPLTGDFEFTCTIEFAPSDNPHHNAGVFFGPVEMAPSAVFTLFRGRQSAGVHIPPGEPDQPMHLPISSVNPVRVRFQGGKLSAWINEVQAIKELQLPPLPKSKGLRIGVGNYHAAAPVKFRNMTIHRLDAAKAAR